jgi:hypothetical protein
MHSNVPDDLVRVIAWTFVAKTSLLLNACASLNWENGGWSPEYGNASDSAKRAACIDSCESSTNLKKHLVGAVVMPLD